MALVHKKPGGCIWALIVEEMEIGKQTDVLFDLCCSVTRKWQLQRYEEAAPIQLTSKSMLNMDWLHKTSCSD